MAFARVRWQGRQLPGATALPRTNTKPVSCQPSPHRRRSSRCRRQWARRAVTKGPELDRLVSMYQGAKTFAQRSAYDLDETGGTFTDAPSPSTFAAEQVREDNPVEAGAHDVAMAADEWLDLLRT